MTLAARIDQLSRQIRVERGGRKLILQRKRMLLMKRLLSYARRSKPCA